MAIEKGITDGFGGKGISYVRSAGNGALVGDNANLSGYANHYGVLAVCAVNDQGRRSTYSEEGANLWVCAPGHDPDRDRPGLTTTYHTDTYGLYTDDFGGTSAAAAIVSGVVALVRSANTALTWRDVKLILAASARQTDPAHPGWEEGALQAGAATARYSFNHAYGFGVVDAAAAVALAAARPPLPGLVEQEGRSAATLNLPIPDQGTVSSRLTLGAGVTFIEFVELNATFDHASFRDLRMELISPAGQVSVLSVPYEEIQRVEGSYRFGTAKHLGENATGTWTLRLSDQRPENVGTLQAWSLTVYGNRALHPPAIDGVRPGPGALTVAWQRPPPSPIAAVTGYDVRYIRTTEDETKDENWTVVDDVWPSGGALEYTIPNLDDVAYQLQVRG